MHPGAPSPLLSSPFLFSSPAHAHTMFGFLRFKASKWCVSGAAAVVPALTRAGEGQGRVRWHAQRRKNERDAFFFSRNGVCPFAVPPRAGASVDRAEPLPSMDTRAHTRPMAKKAGACGGGPPARGRHRNNTARSSFPRPSQALSSSPPHPARPLFPTHPRTQQDPVRPGRLPHPPAPQQAHHPPER